MCNAGASKVINKQHRGLQHEHVLMCMLGDRAESIGAHVLFGAVCPDRCPKLSEGHVFEEASQQRLLGAFVSCHDTTP